MPVFLLSVCVSSFILTKGRRSSGFTWSKGPGWKTVIGDKNVEIECNRRGFSRDSNTFKERSARDEKFYGSYDKIRNAVATFNGCVYFLNHLGKYSQVFPLCNASRLLTPL